MAVSEESSLYLDLQLPHLISFGFVDWTPIFYLKGFVTDSVQVGEAVFEKSSGTTLGFKFKPSF